MNLIHIAVETSLPAKILMDKALRAPLKKKKKAERGGAVKLDSMWQHRLTRPLHVQHT